MTPSLLIVSFLASLTPFLALSAPANPSDPALGPPISFSRVGVTVCASYAKDEAFNLYRKHIFARQGIFPLSLSGIPPGRTKSIAGASESILDSAFKACTTTPSATDEVVWIDQSCMSTQGICLPPRAYSVSFNGLSAPLSSTRAATLFSQSLHPSTTPNPSSSSDGWSFGFKAK